jgi:hypothetical protein
VRPSLDSPAPAAAEGMPRLQANHVANGAQRGGSMNLWAITDVAVAMVATWLGWSFAWRMMQKRLARQRLRERLDLIYRGERAHGYSD